MRYVAPASGRMLSTLSLDVCGVDVLAYSAFCRSGSKRPSTQLPNERSSPLFLCALKYSDVAGGNADSFRFSIYFIYQTNTNEVNNIVTPSSIFNSITK